MTKVFAAILSLVLPSVGICDETKILLPASHKGNWGYVDSNGIWRIHPRFSAASRFSEDVALVEISYTLLIPTLTRRGALINKSGHVLTSGGISVAAPLTEGRALAQPCMMGALWRITNGKYGFLDKNGRWVIQPQFKDASSFSEGLASVSIDGKGSGYVDASGNWAIPPAPYRKGRRFSDGVAVTRWGSRLGLINREGEFVEAPKGVYDLGPMIDGLAVAQYRDSLTGAEGIGAVNKDCSWVFRIDDVTSAYSTPCFCDGLLPVRKGKLFGYIDQAGFWSIKPSYDAAEPFSEGLAAVRLHTSPEVGYIATNGAPVISPRFETVGSFKCGFAPIGIREHGDGTPSKISGYVCRDGTVIRPRRGD